MSWLFPNRVKQLTANSHVLCLGDEEVGDAASCEERPQRPENLCEKNGNMVRIRMQIKKVTTSVININPQ